MPDQLGDALLESAPRLLIAGPLHRRQVALHFPILVPIDTLQLELVLLPLAHQLLHPILVRGLRSQLGVERLVDLALACADRLALLLEAPLRRVQLAGLIVAQPQRGAHVRGPALPHLCPKLLRLRPVWRRRGARVARHLCRERGRQDEQENPREVFHHVSVSRDASRARSCAGLKSSSPTSCDDTGSGAPGCSTLRNSSRSCGADMSLRSTVSTGAAAPGRAGHTPRATTPAPATTTRAAPGVVPSAAAISSYSSPCCARNRNTSRCSRGSCCNPSPSRPSASAATARSCGSPSVDRRSSPSGTTRLRLARRCASFSTLPPIVSSQVRKRHCPRNVATARNARMNVSCTTSSRSASGAPAPARKRANARA